MRHGQGLQNILNHLDEFLEGSSSAQYWLANERIALSPLLLLASDASSYMFGTVLKVDGGFAIDVFVDILI